MKSLISNKQIMEEGFNLCRIECDDISKFMIYYMFILNTASELKLISKDEANEIANYYFRIINEKSENNIILAINFTYIFSCMLSELTNVEALKKLMDLYRNSEGFFNELDNYLRIKFKEMDSILERIKVLACQIGNNKLLLTQEELEEHVKKLKASLAFDTKYSLKGLHSSNLVLLNYSFLKEVKGKNYVETLLYAIKNFETECQIMSALNYKEFNRHIKNISSFASNSEEVKKKADENKLNMINLEDKFNSKSYLRLEKKFVSGQLGIEISEKCFYSFLLAKVEEAIEEAKKCCKKEIATSNSRSAELNQFLTNSAKKKNISDEDMESFFGILDEAMLELESYPEIEDSVIFSVSMEFKITFEELKSYYELSEINDEFEISERWDEIISSLELIFEKLNNKLEKISQERYNVENVCPDMGSFETMIKEYAFIALAKRGVRYPETLKEKNEAFAIISINDAVKAMLTLEEVTLSEAQMSYLLEL